MAAPTAIAMAATKQPKICRILFAAQPQLLAPKLQVIHRVIATFLIKQSGLKPRQANTGAVTLHPALRLSRQFEYSSPLPGARRRQPKLRRRGNLPRGGG